MTKDQIGKFKRIYLEIKKMDTYFMQVDIPSDENNSKENSMAIEIAWNTINDKSIDNEKFRIGDGFENKILKKETIECNLEEKK